MQKLRGLGRSARRFFLPAVLCVVIYLTYREYRGIRPVANRGALSPAPGGMYYLDYEATIADTQLIKSDEDEEYMDEGQYNCQSTIAI